MCQCLSHCLHRDTLCADRYTPIEIVAYECTRVYSATCRINPNSGNTLQFRCEESQVTLRKWKERLSGSSKGECTHLLIHDLETCLERGHRQMNFYLTQVMSIHVALNAYLFRMKLAESLECTNCDRRGRNDNAWHTLFRCLAFQLYWKDMMILCKRWVSSLLHRTVWSQSC